MKILHIDNHAIFRAGIKCILKRLHPTIEFLEASHLKTALAVVSAHQDIDLLLVDLAIYNRHELNELKAVRSYIPTTPTVVITALQNPSSIQTALDVGLAGYIPKSATSAILIRALQVVLEGGRYAPRMARLHTCSIKKGLSPSLSQKLTKRQSEVMALVAEGLSNKAIARKLCVTEATIKGHVTAILMALRVSNRVQAINRWQDVGDALKLAS
jgi:DNA-binding NarL/FixJ family response regulator